MTQAARVGDVAVGLDGAPAIETNDGSPDVFINGLAALRADDAKTADASGAGFQAANGSRGVLINGMPALRAGDAGGAGQFGDGSPDVMLGDLGGGTPKEQPHDRSITIEFTDALGRAIDEVVIDVFCPHQPSQQQTVNGKATIGGLCGGSTVSGHTGLVGGTSDPNGIPALPSQTHHHVGPPGGGSSNGGSSSGGTSSPDGGVGLQGGGKTIVHAPAPVQPSPTVHLHRPNGSTTVQVTTLHNWVELVYKALGFELPTSQLDLAILGVREASLAGAAKRDDLEKEAGWGDVNEVDFTLEHKAASYDDLLFCAYSDKHVKARQVVEVFECTIDASPGKGALHLPYLVEGQLFHCTPGPWHSKSYPGKDITLHVFTGKTEPKPEGHGTAAAVIAEAHIHLGYLEGPDNATMFGDWYGMPNASWCAMFVSWCFAHAGMPYIRYAYVPSGWAEFMNGTWGTWHSSFDSEGNQTAKAEPGDIVFYQWVPGDLEQTHTGIVLHDNGSTITTIEGNTGTTEISDPAGGGVHMRTRTKDSTVHGFGRPRYQAPDDEATSVIRWGGEGQKVNLANARGQTLLHHHYFNDEHGHEKVDPKAARYKRFMQLYNEAKNKKAIPYLIVSSDYVLSYTEWLTWVDANPGKIAPASSVLRRDGLKPPTGYTQRFVPSYFSQKYADAVIAHAKHMHDRHAAKKLLDELEDALVHIRA